MNVFDWALAGILMCTFVLVLMGCQEAIEHNPKRGTAFDESDKRLTSDFVAYRVVPSFYGTNVGDGYINGHEIVESKRISSPDAAIEIRNIFSDASKLPLGYGADCHDPHHALRFGEGEDQLVLSICFECSNIWVFEGKSNEVDFDKKISLVILDSKALSRFLLNYFPDDKQLAGLAK